MRHLGESREDNGNLVHGGSVDFTQIDTSCSPSFTYNWGCSDLLVLENLNDLLNDRYARMGGSGKEEDA